MTNPKKKKKTEELLTVWTNLKQKLMTTIQELKANHKDKWAVVKSKSPSKLVKVLPSHQLEKLRGSLLEKQSLLQAMEQRPSTQLLSPSDQTKHDQLVEEIKDLQAEITWQELINQNPLLQELWSKKRLLLQTQLDQRDYREELRITNDQNYRLNHQLNWLRTLVRAGDINQLQELVRSAKI